MIPLAETTVEAEAKSADAVPSREEQLASMATFMTEGKRDFYANNFTSAANKLGQAATLSAELHGTTAASYDSHLWYGKAMLEVARMQDDIIDNATKDLPVPKEDDSLDEEKFGNPENLSETEKEEIKAQVEEALAEEKAETTVEEAKERSVEDAVEATEENMADESADAADEAEEDDEDDEEEEPTDIQIAWEVLESARLICEQQEQDKTWELNKADVLFYLADVSLVNDDFDKAIDDLNAALKLQEKHLAHNDRVLAQTYLYLARAYKAKDDYKNAADYYKLAQTALLSKVSELVELKETDEEKKRDIEADIENLKSVAMDLELKIVDAQESHMQTENKMDIIRQQLGINLTNTLTEMTSAPAVDITNMVRKPTKRPGDTEENDAAKKSRGDAPVTEAEASTNA